MSPSAYGRTAFTGIAASVRWAALLFYRCWDRPTLAGAAEAVAAWWGLVFDFAADSSAFVRQYAAEAGPSATVRPRPVPVPASAFRLCKHRSSTSMNRFELYGEVGSFDDCVALCQRIVDANPWVLRRVRVVCTRPPRVEFSQAPGTNERTGAGLAARVTAVPTLDALGTCGAFSADAIKFFYVRDTRSFVVWKNHLVLDFGVHARVINCEPVAVDRSISVPLMYHHILDGRQRYALSVGTYRFDFDPADCARHGLTPVRLLMREYMAWAGLEMLQVLKPYETVRFGESSLDFWHRVGDGVEIMATQPEPVKGGADKPPGPKFNSWFKMATTPRLLGVRYDRFTTRFTDPFLFVMPRKSKSDADLRFDVIFPHGEEAAGHELVGEGLTAKGSFKLSADRWWNVAEYA